MKFKTTLLTVFSLILLLFLLIFTTDRFIAGVSLSDFSFWGRKDGSAYTVSEEIRDLYLLNTSEYRVKLIFPFDFVDREVDWWTIKEIHERQLTHSTDFNRELDVYKACLAAGFDPALDIYDFIILTAVVKAGIKISGTVFENPQRHDRFGRNEYINIEKGEAGDIISLKIPDVEITESYIDDRNPDNDNFPDAELTPGQWRALVDFLDPLILEKVKTIGILETARENSRELIGKILKEGGFSEVYFIGQDL